jgi:hypothetical protein
MTKREEFIKQTESILHTRVGVIIGKTILKNNLSKLNKDVASISTDDAKILINNIEKSVSVFQTKDEAKLIKTELEKSLPMLA